MADTADIADIADTDGAILVTQPITVATVTVAVTVADTAAGAAEVTAAVGEECTWDMAAEVTTVGAGTSSIMPGGAGMPRSSDLACSICERKLAGDGKRPAARYRGSRLPLEERFKRGRTRTAPINM
jgi:hypothetical protein